MQTSRQTRHILRLGQRFHDEHVALDQRFEDICERARSGDWRELDVVWRSFADDVEAHLCFEERVLFPAYGEQGVQARELVKRLVAEHAAIRQMLEELGIEIQLHHLRSATVEVFVDLLREHASLEAARIYPWAERDGRPWPSVLHEGVGPSGDRVS